MDNELDMIMEEVHNFDKPELPIHEAVYEPVSEAEREQDEYTIKTRNRLLKALGACVGVGACAYGNLIAPVLYIPMLICGVCYMSYTAGKWKGKNE